MAITYILGGLQLISIVVNLLALGAFWVTPGLRTTANKFVINLLFVNIIGCLALSPALWLTNELAGSAGQPSQSIMCNSSIELHNNKTLNSSQINYNNNNSSQIQFAPINLTNNTMVQSKQHLDGTNGVEQPSNHVINKCVYNGDDDQLACDNTISANNIFVNLSDTSAHVIIDKLIINQSAMIDEDNADSAKASGLETTDIFKYLDEYYGDSAASCKHFWGLDLAGALGKFAIFLGLISF